MRQADFRLGGPVEHKEMICYLTYYVAVERSLLVPEQHKRAFSYVPPEMAKRSVAELALAREDCWSMTCATKAVW